MSLDVWLTAKDEIAISSGIFIRENGRTKEISRAEWDERTPGVEPLVIILPIGEVFSSNITSNLDTMAEHAGLYRGIWRPWEIGIKKAGQLTNLLRGGLFYLKSEPEKFRRFNPKNGWGSYETLVEFTEEYLIACVTWPNADIGTWS